RLEDGLRAIVDGPAEADADGPDGVDALFEQRRHGLENPLANARGATRDIDLATPRRGQRAGAGSEGELQFRSADFDREIHWVVLVEPVFSRPYGSWPVGNRPTSIRWLTSEAAAPSRNRPPRFLCLPRRETSPVTAFGPVSS